MVDFYGLPKVGEGAWPGRAESGRLAFARKAQCVEEALMHDIANEMGRGFDSRRFLPFVVIHEFEGLLFSDCVAFAEGIGRADLEPKLREVREDFETPEHINDSHLTAPSKRVEALVPGYEKPLLGTLAVLQIGLARIRAECPHFAAWLKMLESIP